MDNSNNMTTKHINPKKLWFKAVAIGLIMAFLVNQVSYAIEPSTFRKNVSTLSPASRFIYGDNFVFDEENTRISELAASLQEDAGLLYVSRLISRVLDSHGTLISAKGLRTLIKRHIPQIGEKTSFVLKDLYKEGDTYCLPYLRKKDGLRQVLRFYLPSDKPKEAAGKPAIPIGEGETQVILEPWGEITPKTMRADRALPAHQALPTNDDLEEAAGKLSISEGLGVVRIAKEAAEPEDLDSYGEEFQKILNSLNEHEKEGTFARAETDVDADPLKDNPLHFLSHAISTYHGDVPLNDLFLLDFIILPKHKEIDNKTKEKIAKTLGLIYNSISETTSVLNFPEDLKTLREQEATVAIKMVLALRDDYIDAIDRSIEEVSKIAPDLEAAHDLLRYYKSRSIDFLDELKRRYEDIEAAKNRPEEVHQAQASFSEELFNTLRSVSPAQGEALEVKWQEDISSQEIVDFYDYLKGLTYVESEMRDYYLRTLLFSLVVSDLNISKPEILKPLGDLLCGDTGERHMKGHAKEFNSQAAAFYPEHNLTHMTTDMAFGIFNVVAKDTKDSDLIKALIDFTVRLDLIHSEKADMPDAPRDRYPFKSVLIFVGISALAWILESMQITGGLVAVVSMSLLGMSLLDGSSEEEFKESEARSIIRKLFHPDEYMRMAAARDLKKMPIPKDDVRYEDLIAGMLTTLERKFLDDGEYEMVREAALIYLSKLHKNFPLWDKSKQVVVQLLLRRSTSLVLRRAAFRLLSGAMDVSLELTLIIFRAVLDNLYNEEDEELRSLGVKVFGRLIRKPLPADNYGGDVIKSVARAVEEIAEVGTISVTVISPDGPENFLIPLGEKARIMAIRESAKRFIQVLDFLDLAIMLRGKTAVDSTGQRKIFFPEEISTEDLIALCETSLEDTWEKAERYFENSYLLFSMILRSRYGNTSKVLEEASNSMVIITEAWNAFLLRHYKNSYFSGICWRGLNNFRSILITNTYRPFYEFGRKPFEDNKAVNLDLARILSNFILPAAPGAKYIADAIIPLVFDDNYRISSQANTVLQKIKENDPLMGKDQKLDRIVKLPKPTSRVARKGGSAVLWVLLATVGAIGLGAAGIFLISQIATSSDVMSGMLTFVGAGIMMGAVTTGEDNAGINKSLDAMLERAERDSRSFKENHALTEYISLVQMVPTDFLTDPENVDVTMRGRKLARIEWLKGKIEQGNLEELDTRPIRIFIKKDGVISIDEGQHRLEAFRRLGVTHVPAQVVYWDKALLGNYQFENTAGIQESLLKESKWNITRDLVDYSELVGTAGFEHALERDLLEAGVYVDAGCGMGIAAVEAAEYSKNMKREIRVYGVDAVRWTEKDVRKMAKVQSEDFFAEDFLLKRSQLEKEGHYSFLQGDITDVKLPVKADIITSFFVLQYVEDPLKAIINLYNQLEKQGKIYVSFVSRKGSNTAGYYEGLLGELSDKNGPLFAVLETLPVASDDAEAFLVVIQKTTDEPARLNRKLKESKQVRITVRGESFNIREPIYDEPTHDSFQSSEQNADVYTAKEKPRAHNWKLTEAFGENSIILYEKGLLDNPDEQTARFVKANGWQVEELIRFIERMVETKGIDKILKSQKAYKPKKDGGVHFDVNLYGDLGFAEKTARSPKISQSAELALKHLRGMAANFVILHRREDGVMTIVQEMVPVTLKEVIEEKLSDGDMEGVRSLLRKCYELTLKMMEYGVVNWDPKIENYGVMPSGEVKLYDFGGLVSVKEFLKDARKALGKGDLASLHDSYLLLFRKQRTEGMPQKLWDMSQSIAEEFGFEVNSLVETVEKFEDREEAINPVRFVPDLFKEELGAMLEEYSSSMTRDEATMEEAGDDQQKETGAASIIALTIMGGEGSVLASILPNEISRAAIFGSVWNNYVGIIVAIGASVLTALAGYSAYKLWGGKTKKITKERDNHLPRPPSGDIFGSGEFNARHPLVKEGRIVVVRDYGDANGANFVEYAKKMRREKGVRRIYFDLDLTVFRSKGYLSSSAWFERVVEEFGLESALTWWGNMGHEARQIRNGFPYRLMDPSIPEMIKELKKEGFEVKGLTARYSDKDQPRTGEILESLGVHIDEIVFTSGSSKKGEVLDAHETAKDGRTGAVPAIFVEDSFRNLETVLTGRTHVSGVYYKPDSANEEDRWSYSVYKTKAEESMSEGRAAIAFEYYFNAVVKILELNGLTREEAYAELKDIYSILDTMKGLQIDGYNGLIQIVEIAMNGRSYLFHDKEARRLRPGADTALNPKLATSDQRRGIQKPTIVIDRKEKERDKKAKSKRKHEPAKQLKRSKSNRLSYQRKKREDEDLRLKEIEERSWDDMEIAAEKGEEMTKISMDADSPLAELLDYAGPELGLVREENPEEIIMTVPENTLFADLLANAEEILKLTEEGASVELMLTEEAKPESESQSGKEKDIYVKMGEMQIASSGESLYTNGLGSCLAIVLYDPVRQTGAMAHAILPSFVIHKDDERWIKFIDYVIPVMLGDLEDKGSKKENLVAGLFGGASMLPDRIEKKFFIGENNVKTAKEILQRRKIPVVAEDIGGNTSRSVFFDLNTGEVKVKYPNEQPVSVFNLLKKEKILPDGSPHVIFKRLWLTGKMMSVQEVRKRTKGKMPDGHLSVETVERDLNTLAYLELVKKTVKEKKIAYGAKKLEVGEWEKIEPILKALGRRPTSQEKKQAKEKLIQLYAPSVTFPLTAKYLRDLPMKKSIETNMLHIYDEAAAMIGAMEESGWMARIGDVALPDSLNWDESYRIASGRMEMVFFGVDFHKTKEGHIAFPVTKEYVFSIYSRGKIVGHGIVYRAPQSGKIRFRYSIHGGPIAKFLDRADYRGKGYGKEALSLLMAASMRGDIFQGDVKTFAYSMHPDDAKTEFGKDGKCKIEGILSSAGFDENFEFNVEETSEEEQEKQGIEWVGPVKVVENAPQGDGEIKFSIYDKGGLTVVQDATYNGKAYVAKYVIDPRDEEETIVAQAEIYNDLKTLDIQGIPEVAHFLELEDGKKVILFEQFPGGWNLRDRLGESPKFSEKEAVDITLKASKIVQDLEAAGVYHWDIKPANIWLTYKKDVILFDFDFAFRTKEDFLERRRYISRTAPYTSENRYKWVETGSFDAEKEAFPPEREEVYSLGMTLLHMLTQANQKEKPQGPPGHYASQQLAALDEEGDVTEGLKSILHKAVSEGNCDYENVDEFIQELEKHVLATSTIPKTELQETQDFRDFADALINWVDARFIATGNRGQTLIIGIDTSWIPELQMNGMGGMQSLLKKIEDLSKSRLKGFQKIKVCIDNDPETLALKLAQARQPESPEEDLTPLPNMVIIGEKDVIDDTSFFGFISSEDTESAYFAKVQLPNDFNEKHYDINMVKLIADVLEKVSDPNSSHEFPINLPSAGAFDSLIELVDPYARRVKAFDIKA